MAWTTRVAEYLAELRRLGRAQFLAAYPNPILVHHFERAAEEDQARTRGRATTAKFRTEAQTGAAGRAVLVGDASDLEAAVHPLRKRPGNPYPDTITIGRADSNDVIVSYDDLSKLQAYFTRAADGGLLVADAGSTNGTWLGSERLPPNEPRPLAERDELGLGEHGFVVFGARALADWLATFTANSG